MEFKFDDNKSRAICNYTQETPSMINLLLRCDKINYKIYKEEINSFCNTNKFVRNFTTYI